MVDQLLEKRLIADAGDLYRLQKADLVDLDRMGEKSAQNILQSLEASKQRPLSRLLNALGIRYVGERGGKALASHFPDLAAIAQADVEVLAATPEIGEKIAESIKDWFRQPPVSYTHLPCLLSNLLHKICGHFAK